MAAYHCTDASVKVDDWWSLAVVDHGSNSSGSSLFILTKDMPIVINQNLYTSLRIVNGKQATAVDFALDKPANVYSFGYKREVGIFKPWFYDAQMPLSQAQDDKST